MGFTKACVHSLTGPRLPPTPENKFPHSEFVKHGTHDSTNLLHCTQLMIDRNVHVSRHVPKVLLLVLQALEAYIEIELERI